MATDFEDYVYEEAGIRAAELVGPNSYDYEHLTEQLVEDEVFVAQCAARFEKRIRQGV